MGDAMGAIGKQAGVLLAPLVGAGAKVRHARLFHPSGVVRLGEVEAAGPEPWARAVGRRLEGRALVRLSSALWRAREWKDALGIAVRFRGEGDADPATLVEGDQDLLFATIRRPWTTPFAPLTTDAHDFCANDYYAVSPFEVEGVGRCKLRLVGPGVRFPGDTRGERLAYAVEKRLAVFRLELLPLRLLGAPSRRQGWQTAACLRLGRELGQVDQEALHFSPFRAGRGVRPTGFVHGMRAATYAEGQAVRPDHEGEAAERGAGRR